MRLVLISVAAWSLATMALAGEPSAPAFTKKPVAGKAGDKVKIEFALSAPTDVEVAIVNAKGDVVRSLAAGVLGGKNPPPPPLKPGLNQSLEWDGKGDWNLPVGNGPFKVRVRAGMSVRFGRMVGDSPYNFNEIEFRGLAVDPKNGDLYVMGLHRDGACGPYFLRVYDRTGKYLRELMPCPGNLDEASRKPFGLVSAPGMDVPAPMIYDSPSAVAYPFNPGGDGAYIKLMGLHPTKDAALILEESMAFVAAIRKVDGGACQPFLDKLGGAVDRGVGPVAGAIAPDGKTMYFAGIAAKNGKGHGRIYCRKEGGEVKTFAEVPLAPGTPAPRLSWVVQGNVQAVHGVTVTRDGRVLVCDTAGGKVWIFTPDGKPAGSASVPGAYVPALDDKSGALYVLTRSARGDRPRVDGLVKLDGCKPDSKVVANLPLKGGPDEALAGDFTAETPQLWVSQGSGLLRIEDQGGKLTVAEDLFDRGKTAMGVVFRMAVDAQADLVYANDATLNNYRYNGLTGEYAGPPGPDGGVKAIQGSELCVRRDGMIYVVTSSPHAGPWQRLNRDLSPAPLPDGTGKFGWFYGKAWHAVLGQQGAAVTPGGDLYYNCLLTWRANGIAHIGPDGRYVESVRLKEFRDLYKDKKEKAPPMEGVVIGWLPDQSGGVALDQQGNIYAGVRVLPRDYVLPGDLAKARNYPLMIGSVIKFKPTGGGMFADDGRKTFRPPHAGDAKFETAVPEKFAEGLPMGLCQSLPKTYFEGAVRAYPGLAPYSGAERPNSGHCTCHTPRFGIDDYGRLYIPNALSCSVQVVDNEGNEIIRFGSYGNFDSQGPESTISRPGIPLAYPVAAAPSWKHIYVADRANRRVVRADPNYALEETCPVR